MEDMRKADVILVIRIKHKMSTPMDTSEKLMPNNGQAVSQLEYSRVIGCLMNVMTCTRPNIAFVVGKLSRWIINNEDNSSTIGWVFILGGDAVFWASKKQTCITSSTMKFEFVALAVAEHPDSDRGIREFKSRMQFSECSFFIESNSGLNDIHQMASALYSLSSKLKDTIRE
nr:hypothetical protein [Tanacetum cinerariifolium]